MMRKSKFFWLLPVLALVLAACGQAGQSNATGTPISLGATVTPTTESLTTATQAAGTTATESTAAAGMPTTETTRPAGTPTTRATLAAGAPTTGATSVVGTPQAQPTQTARSSTGVVPVTGSGTINIKDTPEYGPILVNEDGLALYIFKNDRQYSGDSDCTNECAAAWPPLITDGPPDAGTGVDAVLLATLPRDDGSTQVTYNGWPLYLYQGDTSPGDTNGHGVNDFGGRWYLVKPDGNPL